MAEEETTTDHLLLDTIIDMTAASVERADLDDRELLMVRLAALAAVGAPVSSYYLNIAAAVDTDMTLEDARSVLITIAPIVGTPKVVSAAAMIAEALGIAIAIDEGSPTRHTSPRAMPITDRPRNLVVWAWKRPSSMSSNRASDRYFSWWRPGGLNRRPSGYEPIVLVPLHPIPYQNVPLTWAFSNMGFWSVPTYIT